MSFINLLEMATYNCHMALENSIKTELSMKCYYCTITEAQWLKVTNFDLIYDSDNKNNYSGFCLFVKALLSKV